MDSIRKEYKDRVEWRNKGGELHREDGPAIEYHNGTKEWFINGKLHRECGPAVEWYDGDKGWWLNDHFYFDEETWKEDIIKLKLNRIKGL